MLKWPSFPILLALVLPLSVAAQVRFLPDEVKLVDVIAIERDERNIFAFDALTGRRSRFQLELGEEIRFEASRGRVGLVLTDRRAMGIATGIDWQELRYALKESAPDVGLVEDRIAIVVTEQRALGFTGSGSWVEQQFDRDEAAAALRVGSAVAVVATNRRALGLSPDLSRFVEIDLQLREVLQSIDAAGTLATLRTNRRILVFSAPRAVWIDQKRLLN